MKAASGEKISLQQPFWIMEASQYEVLPFMQYGISHFYCFINQRDMQVSPLIVSDVCTDIIYCMSQVNPHAFVCGPVLSPREHLNFTLKANQYYFGVRFLPGVSPNPAVPFSEFVDREFTTLEVFGKADAFDAVVSAKAFRRQISAFLKGYIPLYDATRTAKNHIANVGIMLQEIMEARGNVSVQQIASNHFYSVRYINQEFQNILGMAPKAICKTIRFQSLLDMIVRGGCYNLNDLAAFSGYFDQSHMIKEFKFYTGMTPSGYIQILKKYQYQKRLSQAAKGSPFL